MARQIRSTIAPTTKTIQSDNYVSIYSNNAQLQMSVFDVRMIFGEGSFIEENTQQIEQKVAIVMSLHHAKAFAEILSENVKKYEQKFGKLKLPAKTSEPPFGNGSA